jgi:hypothetical protein
MSSHQRKTKILCSRLSEYGLVAAFILLAGFMSASCASFGAKNLVSSHTSYNDAVQLTVTREVLANIVRSRYSDPMQFMTVSAINAQFSVNVGGSAGVGGIGQAGTAGDAGGSIGYSDSPTITYVPQSDYAFYRSFYGLFGVEEAVGFALSYRFLRTGPALQAMALRFSVAAINGVSDYAGGKYSELYDRRLDAVVRVLRLGASFRQIPEWDFDTLAIPKWRVTAEDMVFAFKFGFSFIEDDAGDNVRLARYRMVLALTLPEPENPETRNALEDLGVKPGRSQYVLRPPTHSDPDETDPYAIWVTPRSIGDMLNLAARFVDVPATHANIVPPLEPLIGESSAITSIRIRSSKDQPPYPYRVQHRGYWFYVDDTEIASKMFLESMVAAYASRVGSKQADDAQPQLVVPVGRNSP